MNNTKAAKLTGCIAVPGQDNMHHMVVLNVADASFVHEQEQYLSRELELMLDRLESPAWNLAHQSEQAPLAQPPVARLPAAYHPKVPTPPHHSTAPSPLPKLHNFCICLYVASAMWVR